MDGDHIHELAGFHRLKGWKEGEFYFRVTKEGIEISEIGSKQELRKIRWSEIKEVSLNYHIQTQYSPAAYQLRIDLRSQKPLIFRANQSDDQALMSYRTAVMDLQSGWKQAGRNEPWRSGEKSKFLFWFLFGWFALLFAGLAVAAVMGSIHKHKPVVGVFALFLVTIIAIVFLRMLYKLAGPATFRYDEIPEEFLPG